MEAEFVNEYINRLLFNLHDLMSKNIMQETRLVMADRTIADLANQVRQQTTELDKYKKKKGNQLTESPVDLPETQTTINDFTN